jgi:uncharacterized secreted protein with C-terminal beta-propeller domain
MSKKSFQFALLLVLMVFLASGCTPPWKKPAAPPSLIPDDSTSGEDAVPSSDTSTKIAQLKKFNNYEELAKFLAEHDNPDSSSVLVNSRSAEMGISGTAAGGKMISTAAPMASESFDQSADNAAGDISQPSASLDYSSTNNQVAGVDEADIIKTDGQYIYALVRSELSIIQAAPADEAKVISKITFKSRPQDIFIKDNYLAVFGSDEQIYAQPLYRSFRRQNPYAFFKVFDLTDRTNPKLVRDLDFEGSYYDARLIGDYVYFITNTYGNYVAKEPLIPRVLDSGQVLPLKCEGVAKCFAPDVFYFDVPYDYYNFTNITAINIKNNGEALGGQVYLLNSGQNLYVSQDNIYITYTQYLNEYDLEQTVKRELVFPKLNTEEQAKITKIEAADVFILNNNEKKYKVAMIIDRYLESLNAEEQTAQQNAIDEKLKAQLVEKEKEMEQTVIHKIGVKGNTIEYKAVGQVTGQVLNQFSMDESGDYFRLATTRSRSWSRFSDLQQESYSNIYVLDKDLKLVGKSKDLGSSERIYSARFMGDRVYIVTFRQTDPLYVISLSDPKNPTLLGSVKIPGFSNYLHPVDKNGTKLLGLGRAAEERSDGGVTIKGLKLSLFDFSDLTKPQEVDSYLIGDANSDSIALSDHKAFLYSEDKNIVSFPAVLHDTAGRLSFAGSLVFSLADNQLNLKGRIDHSAGGHFTQNDYWNGYGYYDNTVKRSLYIGENLYTFSNKYLKINALSDLSERKSLELTVGGDDYIITTPMPLEDRSSADSSGSGLSGSSGSSGSSGVASPSEVTLPVLPENVPAADAATGSPSN